MDPRGTARGATLASMLHPSSHRRGGTVPNNILHSMAQSLSSVPVIDGPSMHSPRSTVSSCNVIIISPTRRWYMDVSDLHLSIRAVSKALTSFIHLNWEWIKNFACVMYSMIRSRAKTYCWQDREWSNISITPRSYNFAHKLQLLNVKKNAILIFKLTFIKTYLTWVDLSRLMHIM